MLWLVDDGRAPYVVYPESVKVGIVSETNFTAFGPGLFAWEIPLPAVILGGVPGKSDNIQPRLEIRKDLIEFSPYPGPDTTRIATTVPTR